MRIKLAIMGVAVALFVLIALVESQEGAKENNSDLVPHKLFDFVKFKKMFNKSYGSVMEELARQKIFFARAFRAFLSFVSYKHKKSTSYSKINEMSDWTTDEFRSIEIKRPVDANEVDSSSGQTQQYEEEAADLADIEAKLREIVDHQHEDPTYATIAKELENSNRNSRIKRNVNNSNKKPLTIDSLFEEPEVEELSEKVVDRVPSNNANYEPPELSSYGAEDDNKPTPMSEWQTKFINNLPGAEIVGTMLSGASELLFGVTKPVDIVPSDLPDEVFVDHRQSKCLLPVKHQGRCGSCYIFSTMALYEWRYCKETGNLAYFSEQYVMDCSRSLKCHGGQEADVGAHLYVIGVELSRNYPYRQRDTDTCPYDKNTPTQKMGYLRVNEPKLTTISHSEFENYIKHTPILLGFGVSDQFHHYANGVDLGKDCDRNRGHSMLVIGSGRENGIDYWLIRNSYGPSWGDKGHYKIAKQAKNCFLDRGIGWILKPKNNGKVFGSVNKENDGQAVKDHLMNYSKNNIYGLHFENNRIVVNNPNIATPSSLDLFS